MARTFEATQKADGHSTYGWKYLDLKNRKQAGDIEKKILNFNQRKNAKIFNFTSSRGNEGVSTILVNILDYYRFQKSAKKILVIDANFRSPALHHLLKLELKPGLSELLKNTASFEEVLQSCGSSNIDAISIGQGFANLSSNVDQEKLQEILVKAKDDYDYIFVDSSPLLSTSDGTTTSITSDVTFLVILSLKVQKEVALKAKGVLIDNECCIGGVILNRVQQVIPGWMYRVI